MAAFDPVLGAIVDRCASLRQQIDDLNAEKRALEAELIASGESSIAGSLFVVSISRGVQRSQVDWKAIAEKLEPSRQLIAAHSSKSDPFDVVRYNARPLPS